MSSKTFERIVKLLEDNQVGYELLEHEPAFTSEQAAKVRGTNLASGAKALIFKADKKPIMIVIPGDKRVEIRKFKNQFGIKDLAFAKPEEVEQITEGVKVGAVHPFGNLHYLPVYVDRALGKIRMIVFNAGLHNKSIKMAYKDYERLTKPIQGNFTT